MAEMEDIVVVKEGKFSGFVLDPEKCSQLTLGEKRELVNEIAQWPEDAPKILSSFTRRELLEIICAEMGKERKYTGMAKGRMINHLLNVVLNRKKQNTNSIVDAPVKSQSGAKRQKRSENSNQQSDSSDPIGGSSCIDDQVKFLLCDNLACRAAIRPEDGFCKRCSCCICHRYDDNKDPSLWLTCNSDSPNEIDSCGLSCHLKCALKHARAGIHKNSSFKKLDGQFSCVTCGKINDLMSTWRKQLMIAKEARRVDVLCLRISLCCKILDGTKLHKDVHKVVFTAAKKLKKELGPLDRVCAKMGRGIVNRLACGAEVQKLCTSALESYNSSFTNLYLHSELLKKTPTCRIHFAESYSTSVTIVLEYGDHLFTDILGCRIWHRETIIKSYPDEPTFIISSPEKKLKISDLKPSTEYTCRVSMFSSTEILGTWEANWITSALDTHKNHRGHLKLNVDQPITTKTSLTAHWPDDIKTDNMQAFPFVSLASIPTTPSKIDGKLVGHNGMTRNSEGADFDHCVRAVKALECEGHVSLDFRVKFLTWYSLKASKKERRVVSAFVDVMGNDPPSLAEQLIDTFGDEICGEKCALN
ncbi:hypothetical protein V2J09_011719 [Rumex salicifolius]